MVSSKRFQKRWMRKLTKTRREMKRIITIMLCFLPLLGFSQSDSLRLQSAIGIALENNYGIIIQEKSLNVSKINNTWGNTGVLPTLSLAGKASESWGYYTDDNNQTSSQNATVNLDWVVFRGFGARIQKEMLNELENMSETNLALVTENTIVNVTLAYYQALLQHENMKSAKQIMELSEDRYKKEKIKKNIGGTKTYDVLQSQNAWLEDKSNYLSAKTNYNNSIRQLNFLMATPVENTYTLIMDFTADTTSFEKQVLLEKMMSNNNTLKNQYINLEMARLEVRQAKSAYYPTITANVNGGYANSGTDYNENIIMNNSTEGFTTGVSAGVSYTLFEGGQRKQALKASKIEEEISSVETNQMIDELKNQLAQEYELYDVRKELLVVAKENMEAAKLNLQLSAQKYESGAINSFNFRDVQLIYINSVWSYYSAIFNVIESYHALMQLTGGVIEEFNT